MMQKPTGLLDANASGVYGGSKEPSPKDPVVRRKPAGHKETPGILSRFGMLSKNGA